MENFLGFIRWLLAWRGYLGLDIDMNGDEEEEGFQVPLDDGSVQEILSSEKKVFIEIKFMWLNVFEWLCS
jgi:hypothetical protein